MRIYSYLKKLYSALEAKKKKKYLNGLIDKGLRLGKNVNIVDNYFFDPSHCFLISIGDNCTIAPNVRLIAHDASIFKLLGYSKIGKIDIKENCFIGDSVIVLPGVTIGQNSIIGSGSIVTHNIPPDMVAAGNPAKLLMSIQDYIKKIENHSKDKKIFGEDYFIEKIDEKRRQEMIDSVDESIGFMR